VRSRRLAVWIKADIAAKHGFEPERTENWLTPKHRYLVKSVSADAAPEGAASFSGAASSGYLCQAFKTRWLVIGNTVIRLPIALKIALAMAGAIASIVGSPAPHEGVLGVSVNCSG